MNTILEQQQTTFQELWKLEPTELEIELGRILALTRKELETAAELTVARPIPPSPDNAQLMGTLDTLRDMAKRFLVRFDRQLYGLLCDPNDPDNKIIQDARNQGAEKLGLVLSGVLLAHFGWLPAIATVVAAMVAKRFLNAAYQEICETWQMSLPSE